LGPSGGMAHPGATLYRPVQPSRTKGRRGTLAPARMRRENAAGGAVSGPARRCSFVRYGYLITTERLTLNVSSEPGFTTTW